MNPSEYYKRVSSLLHTGQLHAKRVAIVGLGSGGARVASELGRLGVQLLLIERPGELLKEHNIARHELGFDSLGKPKLAEVRKRIKTLNPSTRVIIRTLDVIEAFPAFSRVVESWRPDLIAACTDNEQSKHAVNQVAIHNRKPQVGAGVYDGGIGGEVYWVRPGDACYGCIACHLHLQRDTRWPQKRSNYNPSLAEQRASAALNIDIGHIALIQARVILDLLSGGRSSWLPPTSNLCVFSNRSVPSIFPRPLHAEFYSIPRQADCLTCTHSLDASSRDPRRSLAPSQPGYETHPAIP